jgi:hypothetical protein
MKWHGILPPRLKFKWGNVLNKTQGKKEGLSFGQCGIRQQQLACGGVKFIMDVDDKCQMRLAEIP